jgi:hypothetical protein
VLFFHRRYRIFRMSQYKWEDGGDASDLSESRLEDGGDASDVYPLSGTGNEPQAAVPKPTEPSTEAVVPEHKAEPSNSSNGSNTEVTEPVADLLGPEAEARVSSKKKKNKGVLGALKKLTLPGMNKNDN